ncbi:MAG: polymorphic toxin type 44 domain-containing protein [Defluviitaleaceae bacterium]|nr:polymorphic toxin type 44 domain-containing protein [Defluviitaleaceae bacterium]
MPQELRITERGSLKSRAQFSYYPDGNLSQRTDYIDNTQSIITQYEYINSMVTKKTTSGVSEHFQYDALNRLTSFADRNGNATSYQYDGLGRLTRLTHPDNSFIQNTYTVNTTANSVTTRNENGTQLTYHYDRLGRLTRIFDVQGDYNLGTYEYDGVSRLIRETNSNNVATSYTYDHYDRILTMATGTYTETYIYTDVFDSLTSRVRKTITGDANSPDIVTFMYIDKFGRVSSESVMEGGVEKTVGTYSYNFLNHVITFYAANRGLYRYQTDLAGRQLQITDSLNNIYRSQYDMLGRLTSVTDPMHNVSRFFYDNLSRLIKEELPFEGNHATIKIYEYDNNGNLTKSSVSNNRPGGSLTYRSVSHSYDNRNRLTRTTYADNSFTSYTYDNAGNMRTMSTANGTLTTTYEYDRLNRLIKLTDPMGMSESYVYDRAGNLTGKTDKNGVTLTYAYDSLNNLTSVRNGSTTLQSYTYTRTGLRRTESGGGFTATFTYNELGRLVTESESNGIEKRYKYDISGNRLSFELWRSGTRVSATSYGYDILNRLIEVRDDDWTTTYTYDANGNRASLRYGNGVITTYAYNGANLVTSVTNSSGSTTLSRYTYAYLLDGNQFTKTDHTGRVTTYTYDNLGRLTREAESGTGGLTKDYQYSTAGNRSHLTVTGSQTYTTAYTYDRNNRLTREVKTAGTTETTTTYTYDSNGNQLTSFTSGSNSNEVNQYDAQNRLVRAENMAETAVYAYKPNGQRLSKTVNGTQTTHIWDGFYIAAEMNASSQITSRFVRGVNLIRSGNTWYLFNGNGDVMQLANQSGQVVREYRYDAFGVQGSTDTNDTNPFRYGGEYFDRETGNIYLRARYYDPRTERFTQQDPIRDGLNWYTYGNNNLIMYHDPTGLIAVPLLMGVATAVRAANNVVSSHSGSSNSQRGSAANPLELTDADRAAGVKIVNVNGVQYFDVTVPMIALFNDTSRQASGKAYVSRYSWSYVLAWMALNFTHGSQWDIKNEREWRVALGGASYPGNDQYPVVFLDELRTPDDLGNMLWGYAGRGGGISRDVLYAGGHFAAGSWDGGIMGGFRGIREQADDPHHQLMIGYGIDLYDNYTIRPRPNKLLSWFSIFLR